MTMTLLDIDPRTLAASKRNVRSRLAGVDELAASINQVGILTPLVVRPNGGPDTYVIVSGHRRAAAAIKAGLDVVPCVITSIDGDQADLAAQLADNMNRDELDPTDEAKGFEQLQAFGMAPDEIASLTGRDVARVETGLKVAKSKTASTVGARYDLTLEQTAAIAEFETDKAAVKKLTATAEKDPEYFNHTVSQLRGERDRQIKRAELRAKLQSEGVHINKDDERPGYRIGDRHGCDLSDLKGADGKQLTAANHKKCPGHAVWIDHWGSPEWLCRDPLKYGHKARYGSSTSSTSSKAGMSPAEQEKARKERRELIANNKAMDAATPVRREFVKDLLARKEPPKGTLGFVTPIVVDDPYLLRDVNDTTLTELTGAKPTPHGEPGPLAKESARCNDARRQVLLLAAIAIAIEATWARDVWRRHQPIRQAQYLTFLASCGYRLADVEQLVVDKVAPRKTAAKKVAPKKAAAGTAA